MCEQCESGRMAREAELSASDAGLAAADVHRQLFLYCSNVC